MRKIGLTALFVFAAIVARAEPLLPTADGTTWTYSATEETGGPGAGPAESSVLTVRVGRQTFEGKEFLIETLDDDSDQNRSDDLDDREWLPRARQKPAESRARSCRVSFRRIEGVRFGDSTANWPVWDAQHFTGRGRRTVESAAGSFALSYHCAESSSCRLRWTGLSRTLNLKEPRCARPTVIVADVTHGRAKAAGSCGQARSCASQTSAALLHAYAAIPARHRDGARSPGKKLISNSRRSPAGVEERFSPT